MQEKENEHKVNAPHKTEEKLNRMGILKKISLKNLTIYLASILILVVAIQKINGSKNPQVDRSSIFHASQP